MIGQRRASVAVRAARGSSARAWRAATRVTRRLSASNSKMRMPSSTPSGVVRSTLTETLRSLPPHLMKELDRFFRDYKGLEGKAKADAVEVGDMYGYLQALEVIRKSRNAYDRGEGR